jgi:hypothetical protein
MKKVIGVILACIFTYLLGAFVAWNFDASTWTIEERLLTIGIALVWSMATSDYIDCIS